MKTVAVVVDSTCDLSIEFKERYQIRTIPLHVHLGEREYSDGIDISPDDIYRWSDENKATPKTSAVSPAEAETVINEALRSAESVICFTISGQLSRTSQVIQSAAQELEAKDRVFLVDSESLSTGIGLLVIEAVKLAEQGRKAADIVAHVLELRSKVRASFVVDTLTYLYRDGRCSGLAAWAGSALQLHPLVRVVNGKMSAGKKYRGKISRAITEYVNDLTEELKKARTDCVFITHSGCDEEIVEAVKGQVEALGWFREVLVTRAGSVIASHCGPGTLGVLFVAGD